MYHKLCFIFAITVALAQNNPEVDYYVNLISNAYKNGLTYEWPTNASEYYSNTKHEKFGSYDFVIIGGGAGGSVAASRLSEVKNWTILVLEAGTFGDNLTKIPFMYVPDQFTHYNWAFKSTPQTTCCLGLVNQTCNYPRGRGVGGSTLINGLMYVRGHKWDYEKWGQIAGNTRWGYDSVLKYFKKSEHFIHNNPKAPYEPQYHGTEGYLNVEFYKNNSPQLTAFLEANKELGFDIVDYNANKLGASPTQFNTYRGQRHDDSTAFLGPAKNRTNLKILTNSYVTRLRFDKNVVKGVEFSRYGRNYYVKAKKEVILSGGSIMSPRILMSSGIGPKKHLEDLGIDVVADLEVGTTLRDSSAFFGINVGTNYTEPAKPLEELVKEYLNHRGTFTSANNNQGVGLYESSYTKGTGIPDIELEMRPANATSVLSQRSFGLTNESFEDLWKNNNISQSILIYLISLHDKSFGTVRLRSKNPYDYPVINSNFLSDPENKDINVLYEAIQLVLKLLETKAFKAMNATLQGKPLRACKEFKYLSKDYWFCALRQLTVNMYHPLGTCPMGTDPKMGAVVNAELKVFGVRNLRIADTSVLPLPVAGHTNAPTVMVGEQLGDLVKMAYKKEVERVH